MDIRLQHGTGLDHHVIQGGAWLSQCAGGANTALLSYAALEFRLAIEKVAVFYWATLLNRPPEDKDMEVIGSFRHIQSKIYELGGNQLKINRHYDFMKIFMAAMKMDLPFHTPNIGLLQKHWSECSELCHVGWPLSCGALGIGELVFNQLVEVEKEVKLHVSSLGWPVLHDPMIIALRDRFVEGSAIDEDVVAYLRSVGLWARAEFPDGRPHQFVGQPVPKV